MTVFHSISKYCESFSQAFVQCKSIVKGKGCGVLAFPLVIRVASQYFLAHNTEARLHVLRTCATWGIFHALTKALREERDTCSTSLLQTLSSNPVGAYVVDFPLHSTCSLSSLCGCIFKEKARTSPFQIPVISRLFRNWPTDPKPRDFSGEQTQKVRSKVFKCSSEGVSENSVALIADLWDQRKLP